MATKQYDNYADLITFTRASTGTYLDSDGLLKTATTNTPRIEYDINGNRKGLLIEEARTNLFPNSVPATATWTEVRATLEENSVASPDGGVNASKLVDDTTATATHAALVSISVVSGTSYTFSAFVKAAERTQVRLNMADTRFPAETFALFDLGNETILNGSVGVTSNLQDFGNGWYRCSVTATATSTGTQNFILYSAVSGNISYTGDGTSGIYVWGAQLEVGSFPTSYISTAGSTATRAADVASIPTSAFGYNADKGTVVVDWSHFMTDDVVAAGMAVGFDNGSSNERMWFYGNKGQWIGSVGGITSFNLNSGPPADFVSHKAATVYGLDDFALIVDAGSILSDTLSGVPTVTHMRIGGTTATTLTFLNGHIKSIQYYPRRLTNTQLQELTS